MDVVDYNKLTELQLLALCVWREARGEGQDGRVGVAFSVKNRADRPCWWGRNIREVVLKPFQYSSFNANDPQSAKAPVPGSTEDRIFLGLSEGVLTGMFKDPTFGATHYFDQSLDAKPPSWANDSSMERTCVIGRLRFYKQRPAADSLLAETAGK